MNRLCLTGNVGVDAEIQATPNSQKLKFSIAHNNYRNNKTTWFKIEAWGKKAELLNGRIKKGMKVTVIGELNMERWTGNDGAERTDLVVNANEVEFLDPQHAKPLGGQKPIAEPTQQSPEDIDKEIGFNDKEIGF